MNCLFESNEMASTYVKYRPGPPELIKEKAIKYLNESYHHDNQKYELLLDIGCGNGQATKAFAPLFKRSIGIDTSYNQIKLAKEFNENPSVEYKVGDAEQLDLEDKTVDLILVGQALHWFEHNNFFNECARVLKPTGCLVAFGYNITSVSCVDDINDPSYKKLEPESARLHSEFMNLCRFDKRIHFLLDGYTSILDKLPSKDKTLLNDISFHRKMTLDSYVKLESTTSGYHNHRNHFIEQCLKRDDKLTSAECNLIYSKKHDILKNQKDKLKTLWSKNDINDTDINVQVKINVPLLLARNLHKN